MTTHALSAVLKLPTSSFPFSVLTESHFLSTKTIKSIRREHPFLLSLHHLLPVSQLQCFCSCVTRWIVCVLDKGQAHHLCPIFLPLSPTSKHQGSTSFSLMHHQIWPLHWVFPISIQTCYFFHLRIKKQSFLVSTCPSMSTHFFPSLDSKCPCKTCLRFSPEFSFHPLLSLPYLCFHSHPSPEIALIKATDDLPNTNSYGCSQYCTCQ